VAEIPDLAEEIRRAALRIGFAKVGIAEVLPLELEGKRLKSWLEQGRHGEMAYMARTADVRIDATNVGMLPDARSAIVLVAPYARAPVRVGAAPGRIARYARGRDYHNVLGKRGRKIVALLRERGHKARCSVDSMPVYERAWAARAGVGFIGKNSCLIVPGLGSHVLLCVVLTTAELPPDSPIRERCGACRLCLDACPTAAILGPRELDARRCVSYLTIELRGSIDIDLRAPIGDRIFGCDDCQDVCPFNQTHLPEARFTEPFAPDPRWEKAQAVDLLAMDAVEFAELARGSPVRRAGRTGMARNAAIVLGNTRNRRYLPVLRHVALTDGSHVVREAARWSAERIAAEPLLESE
jgi:epoxyqueuosine reductase